MLAAHLGPLIHTGDYVGTEHRSKGTQEPKTNTLLSTLMPCYRMECYYSLKLHNEVN